MVEDFKDTITEYDFHQDITLPKWEYLLLKRKADLWMNVVNAVSTGIFTNNDIELLKKHEKLRSDG